MVDPGVSLTLRLFFQIAVNLLAHRTQVGIHFLDRLRALGRVRGTSEHTEGQRAMAVD